MNAGYTLLARLRADGVDAARALIAAYEADRSRFDFSRTTTTHFATLTIIEAHRYGNDELPVTLMLATSFSGPVSAHVRELVTALGSSLRALFACCEDFDGGDDESLQRFIRAHRQGDSFYSGMQHLSPEDVRNHRVLRDAIEDFLDRTQPTGSAVQVHRAIQAHVRSRPDLAWAREPFAPPLSAWFVLHWRTLIVLGIVGGLLAATAAWLVIDRPVLNAFVGVGWFAVVVLAVIVALALFAVREAEKEQKYVSRRQPDAHVRMLAATQNRPVINEVTIAGPIKEEGAVRAPFLRIAFWLVARAAEGIPLIRGPIGIPTVATARWIPADGGRRLIFISNFTNAAEPYVRDFIDVHDGAMHINLTFGFGRGYPKTAWIVKGGALTDPNGFGYVVTEAQRPTGFWYGPYTDMTIDNIQINRRIREGLFAEHDETEAQAWLHLL